MRQFVNRLARPDVWADDLRDYYDVTVAQTIELGTRRRGRRPSLPGSVSAAPVSGFAFEEIWDSRPRDTVRAIFDFYRDVGSWMSFRQSVYHRYLDASRFLKGLPEGGAFCEYGGGIAPVINWIVENCHKESYMLTLVDVPSEHLAFGEWRIRRKMQRLRSRHTFDVLEVQPERLPLSRTYDVIAILEVFEHLPNPIQVATHLIDHLKVGGRLWENFIEHPDANAADLDVAQRERTEVLDLFLSTCTLVEGPDPRVKGSGTRCWVKRQSGP